MQAHGVRALLMGGQACVLYGAAQFSRDVDLAVVADPANLARLQAAMAELQAVVVAVPPFESRFLEGGHEVHFRCGHPEAAGLRVDLMSRLRGVDAFETLWSRRTVLTQPDGLIWNLLSLPDLVLAKKTQRDKDWPMIRALVEAHYFAGRIEESPDALEFWFRELRTPEILVDLARKHPIPPGATASRGRLWAAAAAGDLDQVHRLLDDEERQERSADVEYWKPLKAELEQLRRDRLRHPPGTTQTH